MKKITTLIFMLLTIITYSQSPTVKDLKVTNSLKFVNYNDTIFHLNSSTDTLFINNDTIIAGGQGGESPFIYENDGATLKNASNSNLGDFNIILGEANTVSDFFNIIGGSGNNSPLGNFNIIGGSNNNNNGGSFNIINGNNNTNSGGLNLFIGEQAVNFNSNSIVIGYANVDSSNNLTVNTILQKEIYDTAIANLTNIGGEGIFIPSNYMCIYDIQVVGADTSDLSRNYAYGFTGRMTNNAGTLTQTLGGVLSYFGTNTVPVTVTVEADDANDKLQVQVLSENLKTWRYVANCRLTFVRLK